MESDIGNINEDKKKIRNNEGKIDKCEEKNTNKIHTKYTKY